MEKPFEEIDENTVQKHTDEDYHYAIGYSPQDDQILIYNYDTNDILLSFDGEDFYEDTDIITDTIFELVKEEKIPGVNDEYFEEYDEFITDIQTGRINCDPHEEYEKISFLEECLMIEADHFQSGFDYEKLLEDVEKSRERHNGEDSEDSEEESRGIGR
jgi:hypothetical protein